LLDRVAAERLCEVREAAAVALGEVGHHRQRRLGLEVGKCTQARVTLGDLRAQHNPDLGDAVAAVGDGQRQPRDATLRLCCLLLQPAALLALLLAQAGEGALYSSTSAATASGCSMRSMSTGRRHDDDACPAPDDAVGARDWQILVEAERPLRSL